MRNRGLPAQLLCSLLAATFSSFGSAQLNNAAAQPSSIRASPQRQAALAGLKALAARLPSSMPRSQSNRIFSVDDYRQLSSATIGDGFEMYLVDPHALLSGKRLDQSLYGSGEWRFVVMLDGKGVGLITVAFMNGKWTMVEAGASELAGELGTLSARYAQHAPEAQLRFVRSQQAVADFVEVSPLASDASATPPVYVPLASARTMLARLNTNAATPGATLSDAELGAVLRQTVQRGMRDPRFGHLDHSGESP
jgi:hypothetical protein